MNSPQPDLRDHAGPYGFTRREVGVVAAIIVIAVAVVAYAEWRDSRQPQPVWAIEDIRLEADEPAVQADTTSTALNKTAKPASLLSRTDLIDVNSADLRTLARLPGIGSELARRIIEERSTNGSFLNLTDLQRVRGIGPRKAAMLSGWVRFSSDDATITDTSETP